MTIPNLTSQQVRDLAVQGRVDRDPRYHAQEHVLKFEDIVHALTRCWRVRPDSRANPGGSPRHPNGFIAWCPWTVGRSLRVDFNLDVDEEGGWILVVTAFEA